MEIEGQSISISSLEAHGKNCLFETGVADSPKSIQELTVGTEQSQEQGSIQSKNWGAMQNQ